MIVDLQKEKESKGEREREVMKFKGRFNR